MQLPRPVLAVVLLLPAALILTILGGYWLSPRTPHAAGSVEWTVAWKALAVAALGPIVWLTADGIRHGRPLALIGRIALAAVALIAVWSARFESYGPTSGADDQTYVWPFGTGPVGD